MVFILYHPPLEFAWHHCCSFLCRRQARSRCMYDPPILFTTPTDFTFYQFVAKIKAEKKYESIGAIGYCFGAAVCLRLSVTTEIFDAIVPCHPGGFPLNVLDELVVPSSWVCAEGMQQITYEIHGYCIANIYYNCRGFHFPSSYAQKD